jgi:hypothetical protein
MLSTATGARRPLQGQGLVPVQAALLQHQRRWLTVVEARIVRPLGSRPGRGQELQSWQYERRMRRA